MRAKVVIPAHRREHSDVIGARIGLKRSNLVMFVHADEHRADGTSQPLVATYIRKTPNFVSGIGA
jgi:hypothetical protein